MCIFLRAQTRFKKKERKKYKDIENGRQWCNSNARFLFGYTRTCMQEQDMNNFDTLLEAHFSWKKYTHEMCTFVLLATSMLVRWHMV